MIVKHRRGTTQEWLEVDLIPDEGELVIEECSDGTRKCKIGTGYTKFSKLPYIDDKTRSTLLQEITNAKADLSNKITDLEESVLAELSTVENDLRQAIDTKQEELIKNYSAEDAALKAELKESLNKAIQKLRDETTTVITAFEEQSNKAHVDLKAEIETSLANLGDSLVEATTNFDTKLAEEKSTREAAIADLQESINAARAYAVAKIQPTVDKASLILDSKIKDTTEQFTSEVNKTNEQLRLVSDNFDRKLTDQAEDFDSKITKATEDITASVTSGYEAQIYRAKKQLQDKIDETGALFNIEVTSLRKDSDSTNERIDAHLEEFTTLRDNLTAADATLFEAITALEQHSNSEDSILLNKIKELKKTTESLASEFSGLENRFDTDREKLLANIEDLINVLDNTAEELNESIKASETAQDQKLTEQVMALTESITTINTSLLENIENLRSNTNLTFGEVQTNVDSISSRVGLLDAEVTRKINAVREELTLNKTETAEAFSAVNSQFADTNTKIDNTNKKVDEQTKRINNLIAPKPGELTRDEEVIDIRVGYNGVDHESAGDAVRAIGHDLDALKASLPSYIPSNAVDGLLYEGNQLWLTSKEVPIGDPVTITGGGGGGGSVSTVKVTNNLPSAAFTISKGNEAWIDFTYTSYENEVATGDGTFNIIINDKKIEALSGSIQHGIAKRINVSEHLKNGSNTVKVACADQYGSSRTLVYTITQIELRMESTFNSTQIFNDTITFRYKVFGQIEKTVYILVDGVEVSKKTLGASVSGNELTLIIPKQTHGCHKITAYMTATIGVDTVPSNILEYEVICTEADDNTAIIASVYDLEEATQGDLISIPYMVYDPVQINSDIELVVCSQVAGELVEIERTPITVGRELQFWNTRKYPNGIVVFTISYTYDLYGVQTTVVKSHTVKVNELEVDVTPEEDSMQLYLTAQGRSNNEQNPGVWSYTQKPDGEKTYPTITTAFTGFNWKSNGWVVDTVGDTCLRLNGDARATINFKPFAEDFKADGKTIEFEFVVRDVNDRSAVVIDCFDGTRGFRATPDTAFLKSSGTEVSCRYKDEERIRVAITVEHSDTTSRFVSIYLDGVLSGVQRYADTDNFQQNNPLTITLGSSLCGLDIYNIRIYNKALSTAAVLNNYIADQTVPTTRLQLMSDNDILDENGKVSYDRVKALGQIPIITFTGPMPTYKGDKKKKTTRMKFEDPAHPEMNFDVLLDQIDVQGTSSQFYIRKNWKVKLPEARAHMPGAIPAKVFCIKVDYAEATGTHNTGSANYVETLYDREEVILPPQKDDTRVRTTIQGFPIIIFEKETEDSEPIFSSKGNFNYDKDAENAFGFTDAYKDFGVECWEFCNNTSDPVNFAGEIAADWLEDFEPRYAPKSANFERIEELKEIEELAASGKGVMTEAQRNELATLMRNCIANFKEMHDWVLSTATYTLVDGKRVDITPTALAEPVTYGETTYTEDNQEYRLAKFKYEFEDHFNMHYSSMYYVFTFFALMTDQRAKNLFLTRWKEADGVFRWYPYFYDNDTIFGINNEGALVFDYFHEDTDQLGSSNVFNGQNSVLWNNFRLCFPQEIQATYAKLRSDKKLTYSAIINQFITEGSDKWSAAIYNADADYKYVSMAREHVAHKDEDGNEVTGIDASNLYQVRGPGEHHLRYFIDNRINYCDSKWYAGNYPSDDIFLRIYTPKPADDATQEEIDRINASLAVVPANPNITITPFSDMYAGVRYKSGTLQQERLKAGEPHTFSPLNANETFGDTETAIYGAGEISSLGNLAGLYCGVINLSNAAKLTELTVGSANPAYYNDNFREISVGANRLLRSIDLRNCSGLGIAGENPQKTLELSGCPNIERIYTEGTNLTSVDLPTSGYIKILHLPASINTLVIKNQHYLYPQTGTPGEDDFVDGFHVADYQNIRTLCIENCPNLDTNEILAQCCDINGKYTVERVRLTGIEWGTAEEPLANADFIKSLFPRFDTEGNLVGGIRGIDEKNNPLEDAYLVGTCYIAKLTGEEYSEIKSHYPYLDIKFGEMTSNITFKYTDIAGNELVHIESITSKDSTLGTCKAPQLDPSPAWPENVAFTYEHAGWSRKKQVSNGKDDNENDYLEYIQADALLNIAGDRTLYPIFKAIRKKYPVTFKNTTAPEGSQILEIVDTPYDGTAVYSKDIPIKLDSSSPDLYEFVGWFSPDGQLDKITGPITFYAQFAVKDENRLPDGEDDGDDLPGYTIGWLDITNCVDYNGNVFDGYTLNDSDQTMAITECNNNFNVAVRIPETLTLDNTTYTVVKLGGFKEHNKLELLFLPNTLVELSANALASCTNLMELELPESLQTLRTAALQGCTRLTELTVPANVTMIEDSAISHCVNLEKIIVDNNNTNFEVKQNCLIDIKNKKLIQGLATGTIPSDGSVTTLGQYCFASMPITLMQIPEGISKVANNAFSRCASLKEVILPSSMQVLEATCFAWCYELSKVNLPEGLTDIMTYVFNSCALSEVSIPASVNNILNRSFGDMASLKTVTFNRSHEGKVNIPNIHYEAFINSGPIDFIIPWTESQHYIQFTGTYEKNDVLYDKDIFFGANIGSKLKFIDNNNNLVAELEKTAEGVQKNV